MESFELMLAAGGHANSLGRSSEVLELVKSDPARLDELFDCIYADDAWVRMRAMDTFEKLVRDNPRLAEPYTEQLVNDLTKSSQPSIQWHLAQLFMVIDLSEPQRNAALAWLKDRISDTDVDWIVSANAMKALVYFHHEELVSTEELAPLLAIQAEHKSKTIRKKAKQLLDSL